MAGRRWLQLGVQVVLLLAGLGLLQVAAERTNRRIDLTPDRDLSLSDKTREILREVARPLAITVFYRRGTREQYAGLARRLALENGHVAVELLDLDRHPERGRSVGVTQYGRAALEYEGRRAVALAAPEDELVGGILQVLRGEPRRIALTTGHGERAPGGESDGLGRLLAALGTENYVADLVSLLDGPVPPGTDVLLVAGPRHDLLPPEVDRVAAYLRDGGGVLMLLDPHPLPGVALFLGSLGIRIAGDAVVDRERRILGTDGLAAIVEYFRTGNPVAEAVGNPIGSGAVLPSARSVDVTDPVAGVEAQTIGATGPTAWAMADPARARRGEEPTQAARDVPGPVPVVAMAEIARPAEDGRAGRLVVIGDADFATDAYLDLLGNRDLAMNSIAWLAGEDVLATTRRSAVPEILRPLSPLVLTATQARWLLVATTVVQPAVVLLLGVVVVGLRRRWG